MVLNEGLETLGTDEYTPDGRMWYGVFQESALESVELPSTLKRIEYNAFQSCKLLKSIVLPDRLEYIGEYCLWKSGLQEVWIFNTRITADEDAFNYSAEQHLVVRDDRVFRKD